MKVLRIIQILLLVALGGYLVLLHNDNPGFLRLPFVISLPPALVVTLALLVGWLVGWLPTRMALWRRRREIRRLQQRVSELEQHLPSYDSPASEGPPVIPDRAVASPSDDPWVEEIGPTVPPRSPRERT